MKTDEVIIGHQYLFLNNGGHEHKRQFHNQKATVLKKIKGNANKKAYFTNKRGKKPDKFLLDIGCYANPANLKLIKPNTNKQ
jgi:hypothetical protein